MTCQHIIHCRPFAWCAGANSRNSKHFPELGLTSSPARFPPQVMLFRSQSALSTKRLSLDQYANMSENLDSLLSHQGRSWYHEASPSSDTTDSISPFVSHRKCTRHHEAMILHQCFSVHVGHSLQTVCAWMDHAQSHKAMPSTRWAVKQGQKDAVATLPGMLEQPLCKDSIYAMR